MRVRALLWFPLLLIAFACNRGTGFCPAAEAIQPGAACDNDDLQCAYDLTSPSVACDGTSTVISTSCTCSNGTWSCPDPVDCSSSEDAGDQDAGDQDAGDQDATGADAS